MPEPPLRPARADDLAAIAELERMAFSEPWSEAQVGGQLSGPASEVLVATDDTDRPVGYAAFLLVADEAELLRIAVCPFRQREGVARRMLSEGLARIAARGARRCFLEVSAANAPAYALYLGQGFEPSGRRHAYYADGNDALVLRVELSRC